MTYENRDANEIWSALVEGELIEIEIGSKKDFERLRIRLNQIKAKRLPTLIDIGFFEISEVKDILFERAEDLSDGTRVYKVFLGTRKREGLTFRTKIVDTKATGIQPGQQEL